jgi:hypothetical protein
MPRRAVALSFSSLSYYAVLSVASLPLFNFHNVMFMDVGFIK